MMLKNISICLNAVLPLFIYIVVGIAIRRTGMMTDEENKRLNKVLFAFFYPMLMFDNIYNADLSAVFDVRLIVFALAFIGISVIFISLIIVRIEKNDAARGAMIQAIYRSNFVIMGVMVVQNIFGKEGAPAATLLATFVVPFFNLIAVVVLERFRGGRANIGDILINIAKNPLILGSVAGVLASLAGIVLPKFATDVVGGMSSATTPMALISLGVTFDPSVITAKRKNIAISVLGRLAVVPLIGLPIAAAMGFRGPAFVSLLVMMASPSAVSSYPMAVAMDSDAEIAASAIMISTPLSCVTLFLWLFIFKNLGLY